VTDILMPALSPTMEEGTLTKWHIKAGDTVSAGQVIAEIETDKATMEVEAVDEGEVLEILVAEGSENVKVNTPIARLAGEGGAAVNAPSKPAPQTSVPPEGGHSAPSKSPPSGGRQAAQPPEGGKSAPRPEAFTTRAAGQRPLASPAVPNRAPDLPARSMS
jgi:pyruvate dehydrogenase E1 component beta subunit